jgi:hypothetical protein
VQVSLTVPYWRFVEAGVKPHEVYPKHPQGVLAFKTKSGEAVFARYVKHPGFAGKFFVKAAGLTVQPKLHELSKRILLLEMGRLV